MMSKHLFGQIVTPFGTAANNRGETEGNITTLQKILWGDEVHTTVSAEAIRFAIRWNWQMTHGEEVLNRRWNDKDARNEWADAEFSKWEGYLDDDVLGFMSARAAKEDGSSSGAKRSRGTCDKRRARLEVTRAISLSPFAGDITFNAASPGATPSASSTGRDPVPYGTEMHATRYQYGFALTPEDLEDKERALIVVDTLMELNEVAGNQARFLFDFSPEAVIFRWTDDFAPRILYCFAMSDGGKVSMAPLLNKIEAGDVDPEEIIVGGYCISKEELEVARMRGAVVVDGVKAAADELKQRMKNDLKIK